MKGSLVSAIRAALVVAATVALSATSASAAPTRGTTLTAAPQTTKTTKAAINIVAAGGADFSSADVPYWVELLKKRGLDVSFQFVPDASSALRTVIAGQADYFVGSLPTAILAVVNGGAKIKLIAANNQSDDYILLGKPGITLQNIAGKTLAIDTPGSAGHLSAVIGLQKSGVDPDSVRLVNIGGSNARLTAILAGRVDLAPLHYPQALIALETDKVIQVLNAGKLMGPYLQSGLWASDSAVAKKAQTQRIVTDFIVAQRWAASNKFKYIDFATKEGMARGLTGPQKAKVWDYYKDANFFGINGGICNKILGATLQLNWKLGSLPRNLPGRERWINDTFVKSFLKSRKQNPNIC